MAQNTSSPKHKDLYTQLGLSRSATEADIKNAYRRLARKYHPDVTKDNKREAEERFKAISSANNILGDPAKRKLYDDFGELAIQLEFDEKKLAAHREWTQGNSGRGGWGPEQGGFQRPTGQHFGNFNAEDIWDLFGGGSSSFGGGSPFGGRAGGRGKDLHAVVELDFAQALNGAQVDWNGVTVRIPAGAENGSRLRVPGQGAAGPDGSRGDLVLETHIRPHAYFDREGLDLKLRLPVTVDEAYNGQTVRVPTPDGPVDLKVPPHSQSGSTLRIRGHGVRRGKQRGDLLVQLDVRLPDRDDASFSKAARAAASAYSGGLREGIKL